MKKVLPWILALTPIVFAPAVRADNLVDTTVTAVEAYGSGRVSITFTHELDCGLSGFNAKIAELRSNDAHSEEVISRIQHLATTAMLSGRTVRVATSGVSGLYCKLQKLQLK